MVMALGFNGFGFMVSWLWFTATYISWLWLHGFMVMALGFHGFMVMANSVMVSKRVIGDFT